MVAEQEVRELLDQKEAAEALTDAERRVQSMAVLYDKLYQTGKVSSLSLKTYLGPLVDEVVSLFPNRSKVTLEKEIDPTEFDTKTLSVLGTIANELLTNAMKYAFPHGREGTLRVEAKLEGCTLILAVADDGVGLPPDSATESESGHGLTLLRLLVQQLKGTMRIESDGGSRFTVEIEV